jgi:succinate dehydrogenase flavin-adding protein (antitoxin of CptAB toxin-antitoxin module)
MSYFDKVVERRDAVKAEMDAVLEAVAEENRTDLTVEETEKVDALVEEARSLDTKIEKLLTTHSSSQTSQHRIVLLAICAKKRLSAAMLELHSSKVL